MYLNLRCIVDVPLSSLHFLLYEKFPKVDLFAESYKSQIKMLHTH